MTARRPIRIGPCRPIKIAPCQHCGGTNIGRCNDGPQYFDRQCLDCHATGPTGTDRDDADFLWNRRIDAEAELAKLRAWKREQQQALIHLSCTLMDAGLVKSRNDNCIEVAVNAIINRKTSDAEAAKFKSIAKGWQDRSVAQEKVIDKLISERAEAERRGADFAADWLENNHRTCSADDLREAIGRGEVLPKRKLSEKQASGGRRFYAQGYAEKTEAPVKKGAKR